MSKLIVMVIAVLGVTGCKVGLEKDARVGITGVSSVTYDSDDKVVYITRDGNALRCSKANGGKAFDNCETVDIKAK